MLHTSEIYIPDMFTITMVVKYTHLFHKYIERFYWSDDELFPRPEALNRNIKWPNWKNKFENYLDTKKVMTGGTHVLYL